MPYKSPYNEGTQNSKPIRKMLDKNSLISYWVRKEIPLFALLQLNTHSSGTLSAECP